MIPGSLAQTTIRKTRGGFYTQQIDQSIRFNSADSPYLRRTPTATSDRRTATLSLWLKWDPTKFFNILTPGTDGNNYGLFRLGDGGSYGYSLSVGDATGGSFNWLKRSDVFLRDPSAWYHYVVVVDTTDAIAEDRCKVFLNGTRITDFSPYNVNPSLNYDNNFNKISTPMDVGRDAYNGTYANGYMAEFHWIDGQALGPTDFGELKEGIWIAKEYTGTYGTNGFYIDGATSSFLGKDAKATSAAVTNKASTSSEWSGQTGAYTFATNEIDRSSTVNAIVSTDLLTGDFSFDFTMTTAGGALRVGVFDDQEYNTLALTTDHGGLDSMTNSWYLDKGNNQFRYGGASQGSASGVVNGAVVTIERTGSTIKITDDGSDAHTFVQTFSGPVRVVIAGGGAAFNLDNVQYTADGASGNDNSYYSSGLTTDDQRGDTPNNNMMTFNPLNNMRDDGDLVDGLRVFKNTGATRNLCGTTFHFTTGKYVQAFSASAITSNTWQLGTMPSDETDVNDAPGSNEDINAGVRITPITNYYIGGTGGTTDTGIAADANDTYWVAIDLDAGKQWVGIYDDSDSTMKWFDSSAGTTGDPATGANATSTVTANDSFNFALCGRSSVELTLLEESEATAGTIPTGFTYVSSAQETLGDLNAVIDPTKGGQPSDYFETILYEGNGGGQRVGKFYPVTETYSVSNSVILNDNDTEYFYRTPTSAGNRRTWTFSAWFKLSTPSNQTAGGNRLLTAGSTEITISDSNDNLYVNDGTVLRQTNEFFENTTEWNHVVVAFDTTSGTADDRCKVYINGVASNLAQNNTISQDFDTDVNNTNIHYIGKEGSNYFDGYLAEVYIVDGLQLAATDFGQVDTSTNLWSPKNYTGSLGTNGFKWAGNMLPGTFLDPTGITKIGDMTGQGGLAGGFDGDYAAVYSSSAAGTGDSYIGLNFGGTGANCSIITGAAVYATQFGILGSAGSTINLTLRGSNTSPSTPASDGTQIATTGALADLGTTAGEFRMVAGNNTTKYQYVWISAETDTDDPFFAEVEFFADGVTGSANTFNAWQGISADGIGKARQKTDSPTKNFCTLNPNDVYGSGLTLSEGNLRAVPTAAAYGNEHGSIYVGSGKWVYEVKHTTVFGEAVGWSPLGETIDGSANRGWFMFNDGRAYIHTTNKGTLGTSLSSGDYRYIFYDADKKAMWFAHCDVSSGTPTTLVYENGATKSEIEDGDISNAVFTGINPVDLAPGIWMDTSGVIEINFGQSPFYTTSTLPTGFNTLNNDNLAETDKGLTAISWHKNRDAADAHQYYDRLRGPYSLITLDPDTPSAIATDYDGLTRFVKGGVQIEDSDAINTDNESYAAWQWYMDTAGTGTTNEDGSITTNVLVDQNIGLSIMSYTGTATGGATIGHGLGAVPHVFWTKASGGTYQHYLYHKGLGATKYLRFNQTTTAFTDTAAWNDTEPTSTVITLGNASGTNHNSGTMYCWAWTEIEGFSKFGTYTGNGAAAGPFVYCGFRPAFIITKEIAVDDWLIYDSARDPVNVGGRTIRVDIANAEFDGRGGNRDIDFLSNGFKFRSSNATMNASAGSYIFMAFAEQPFKYANAR